MKRMLYGLVLGGAIACTQASGAEDALLTARVLPLRLATDAAQAAIQACAAKQFHISVVIVDAYGNIKLMMLSDGSIFTTADSARRKAYTAVMMRQSTADIEHRIAANPNAPLPGDGNANFLFLAGGIPIRVQTEVIGAIGVGGAASAQDAECAQAGIDRIQASLH